MSDGDGEERFEARDVERGHRVFLESATNATMDVVVKRSSE
jgi:hypothetical protein